MTSPIQPIQPRTIFSTRAPQSSPIRPRRGLGALDLTEVRRTVRPLRFLSPIELSEEDDNVALPATPTKFVKVMVFKVSTQCCSVIVC